MLPPQLAEPFILRLQTKAGKPPSKHDLSGSRFALDAACMLLWREYFQPSEHVITLLADPSPQFGRDWFLVSFFFTPCDQLPHVARQFLTLVGLRQQLEQRKQAQAASEEEQQGQEEDMLCEEEHVAEQMWLRSQLRAATKSLCKVMGRHTCIPTGLGSRRASLVHKMHCLHHAIFMETGSWEGVQECRPQFISLIALSFLYLCAQCMNAHRSPLVCASTAAQCTPYALYIYHVQDPLCIL